MKTCTRFHFEDVERGDKLFLGEGRGDVPDVEIVVERAFTTRNFGQMIDAEDGSTYYLDDYDIVRQVNS
jgi:hypothetical protein